jgi:alkylation response protein AidB-like acyl-CoA dehydrogenase
VLALTNERMRQAAQHGTPGPEGSVAKLAYASFSQRLTAFCIELLEEDGLVGYDYTFERSAQFTIDGLGKGVRHGYLRALANSIEGGSSEIMRSILAERVLGLPGEPRTDKDVPWKSVPTSL